LFFSRSSFRYAYEVLEAELLPLYASMSATGFLFRFRVDFFLLDLSNGSSRSSRRSAALAMKASTRA